MVGSGASRAGKMIFKGDTMEENIMFKADSVCKNYGSHHVLTNVSFSIKKGEIYGLVGKNGAGKTTIMRIMTGLQAPTSGTIEFGFDRKRLGSVGSLVELPSIYANKTARENLEFQYINLGLKLDGSLEETLAFVGLENTGSKKAGKFSLGMRQRLGIAMAIVGNPEMLILDEPINGLDPQGIIQIRDLIIKLNQEKEMTIIISSHILSELDKIATSYAFIDSGKIVKEATQYEIENAGEKQLVITTNDPQGLAATLMTKGFNAELVSNPGKVTVRGDVNIAQIAVIASEGGFEVTDMHNVETDLEEFFLGLVGGETHA